MGWVVLLILAIVFVFLMLLIAADKKHDEDEEKSNVEYNNQLSDRISKYVETPLSVKLSKYNYYEIYNVNKTLYLFYNNNEYTIKFSDIIHAELFDTGSESITNGYTKSNIESTIGRSIVGGVLAGGAGAVIGGVTGSKKDNSTINTTNYHLLSISINDMVNPEISIDERNLMFSVINGIIIPIATSEEAFKYMRELFYRINLIIKGEKTESSDERNAKNIGNLGENEAHGYLDVDSDGTWSKNITEEEKKKALSFICSVNKGECVILTSDEIKIINMDNLSDLQVDYKILYYK